MNLIKALLSIIFICTSCTVETNKNLIKSNKPFKYKHIFMPHAYTLMDGGTITFEILSKEKSNYQILRRTSFFITSPTEKELKPRTLYLRRLKGEITKKEPNKAELLAIKEMLEELKQRTHEIEIFKEYIQFLSIELVHIRDNPTFKKTFDALKRECIDSEKAKRYSENALYFINQRLRDIEQ